MTARRPRAARPWLDAALPVKDRVDALLSVMTLEEKVGQLHQTANLDATDDAALIAAGGVGSSLFASGAMAGNDRDAGLRRAAVDACQRVAVDRSRLGVPLLFGRDVIHGHRTVFPVPLGQAASWDPDLVRRAAAVAAEEAARDGVAWTFAPMMDISEEPRWGRVAESLGEQPVLAGRLAAAAVRGLQGDDPAAGGSIAACAKHFVGYGLSAGGRDYDTVQVGENTVRNVHLRPFADAVAAGCLTVMAAFNDLDGTPMHAHRRLLRDVLKGEWGFDGLVVADWNGIGQLVDQGVAADLRDAAALALRAGVDLDMCSGAYAAHLADLVRSGELEPELLDDAVRRVLRTKFRLGLFENAVTAPAPGTAGPTPRTRELARELAAASLVLVSDRTGILPLAADPGRIHLTGPFVHDGDALLGTWTLDGDGGDVVTPAAAFTEHFGADRLVVTDGRFSDVAVQEVRRTDLTVALLGEHRSRSGEDRCLATLELPAGQLEVLEQLAGIGKPVVAVVFGGRPLELGRVLELADAVLLAWHPGTETGSALVDVLTGAVEPSGRLPMTFPRSAAHIPTSTLQRPTGRPLDPATDAEHARYLDAPATPLLPFGFGLGYSTVRYDPPVLSSPVLHRRGRDGLGGSVTVSVTVHNTGRRPAVETVQLYHRDPVAAVTRPLRELTDWQRVRIAPGRRRTVRFRLTPGQFAYHDAEQRRRVDDGVIELHTGPDAVRTTATMLRLES